MLFSIAANYLFGRLIDHARQRGRRGGLAFACAVATNLGLLGFFKYANFVVDNLNALLPAAGLAALDVAGCTCPSASRSSPSTRSRYVVDVYRHDAAAQKSPLALRPLHARSSRS